MGKRELKLTLEEQVKDLAVIDEAAKFFEQEWSDVQRACYRDTFSNVNPVFQTTNQTHAFLRALLALWQWRTSRYREDMERRAQDAQTYIWKGDKKKQSNFQRRVTYTAKAANTQINILLWYFMQLQGAEKFSRKNFRSLVPLFFRFNLFFSNNENKDFPDKTLIKDAEERIFQRIRKRLERFSEHSAEDILEATKVVSKKVYETFDS